MKYLLLCLFIVFPFISCSTGRISTTETKPNEAIVFGKLIINSAEPIKYDNVMMHFNDRLWGKNVARIDSEGYFYIKLPLKKNFIALLEYTGGKEYYKNIPDNYLSIDLSNPNIIYYVGDINIDWSPSKKDMRTQRDALGVIREANEKGEFPSADIKESEISINYFRNKFPNNQKEITTKFISIDKLN